MAIALSNNGRQIWATILLSYFEKIAHMSVVQAYVSLWLCGFVALYVGMFVARANKVEGTMS